MEKSGSSRKKAHGKRIGRTDHEVVAISIPDLRKGKGGEGERDEQKIRFPPALPFKRNTSADSERGRNAIWH